MQSQPDLRKLTGDSVSVPQRPLTPQVLCSETTEPGEECTVSVRDLKSRFESNDGKNSCSDLRGRNPVLPDSRTNASQSSGPSESGRVPFQRQRSKSESESQAQQPQKPKSVLAKKGKNSDRLNKPRKSVTFSTNVCLVEAADDWSVTGDHLNEAGYQSDEEGPDSRPISAGRSDDTDSSTSDSPVEIIGDNACMLCHKQGVEQGQNYCSKCTYYMSKFAPSR